MKPILLSYTDRRLYDTLYDSQDVSTEERAERLHWKIFGFRKKTRPEIRCHAKFANSAKIENSGVAEVDVTRANVSTGSASLRSHIGTAPPLARVAASNRISGFSARTPCERTD